MRRLILSSLLLCLATAPVLSQDTATDAPLAGSWSGSLVIGRDSFDMTFNFTPTDGSYQVALISPQMGIYGMPAETVRLQNNRLTIRLEMLAAEYTGRLRMSEAGNQVEFIDGEWFQEGEMVPIILRPAAEGQ